MSYQRAKEMTGVIAFPPLVLPQNGLRNKTGRHTTPESIQNRNTRDQTCAAGRYVHSGYMALLLTNRAIRTTTKSKSVIHYTK